MRILPCFVALQGALLLSPLSAQADALWSEAGPVFASTRERLARERAANPAITRSHFVVVDADCLAPLRPGDSTTIRVDLFGAEHQVELTRQPDTLGYRRFDGKLANGDDYFVLTLAEDGVCASAIRTGDSVFELTFSGQNGVHLLTELDHDVLGPEFQCGVDHTHAVSTENPTLPPEAAAEGDTIIDVAVWYTRASRNAAGGKSAMESQIVTRMAMANNSGDLSGVKHELRLVYMAATSYDEYANNGSHLSAFRGQGDGHMDGVHSKRDDFGADLMALIINGNAGYCGIGYLMTTSSTSFRSSAFSVTVRGCLSGHTLTHEMGHNMACHHDPDNAGSALFSYSYGFRTADNRYRTIMAYSPGSRTNYWSGPGSRFNGYRLGNGEQNNKRSLDNVRNVVGQFLPTKMLQWCDVGGGIVGEHGLPTLTGSGTVNLARPIEVDAGWGAQGAIGALVLGTPGNDVPLFGGVLVPNVMVTLPIVGAGPQAATTVDLSAISRLRRGTELAFQAWYVDPAAAFGVSASNGLTTIIP